MFGHASWRMRLRDLIKESDNVIIMGHKMPDMDAIGAAIGVTKAAQMFGKEAFIVLEGINPSIQKMMEMLREDERFSKRFITPEQAMSMTNNKTLTVVVDTHKASMVKEPRAYWSTWRKSSSLTIIAAARSLLRMRCWFIWSRMRPPLVSW